MAPPRPYWKGYLRLSLVSCPVSLYPATTTSERIAFRQINRKTGHRLRQQLIDDETKEVVESSDRVKGYEVSKGVYLQIDDEELEDLAIESSHMIDIDSFVPREQIDERFLDNPYYIAPNDKVGEEAFAVIREAMRGKGMAALARVVLAKRERVVMLQPWDKGVMATTLRYPYEVRDAATYFDDLPDIKIPKEMLTLAEHILDTKKADFEPEAFVDRYEDALVEFVRTKQAGMPMPKAAASQHPTNVVNLFDALRRSIAQEEQKPGKAVALKTSAPKAATPSASGPKTKQKPKRVEGQRELLLPIAGKGAASHPAKETTKEPAKRPAASPASARSRRKAG